MMRMRFGLTADYTQLATKAITRATGGSFAHSVVIFYEHDHSVPAVYYESRSNKDKVTGTTGVRGPRPLSKIVKWMTEDAFTRVFRTIPFSGFLPFDEEEVELARNLLEMAVGKIKYAHMQIIGNWIEQRLGMSIHKPKGSTLRWTCSETCMRCVPPRFWHYFDMLDLRADNIVPSGSKLMSVLEGSRALLDEHPAI